MRLVLLATMFALAQGPPQSSAPSAEALYNQGLAAEQERSLNGAAYEQAVGAPDAREAHCQLGLALRRRGAQAEAEVHFTEAQRLAPYLPAAQSVKR